MTPHDVLPALVHAVDRLDWVSARALFADVVDVDYSELSGTAAAATSADDLLDQWHALLPGFTATQHLLGPTVLDAADNRQVLHAHVRAWHYLPDSKPWVVAGHYEAGLDTNLRITSLTLRVFHIDGPADATERATSRAKTAPRAPRP